MKIKGVAFPPALLNALRDGQLVVFAGAGVSMGLPANLPSFFELAKKVANRAQEPIEKIKPDIDKFLGELKDSGKPVHQWTAEFLQSGNPKPNALHRNLLRLFTETDPVRIVTTNFDCLFEQASEAEDLFKGKPRVFEAPALPPGSRFKGIVRLHGSVKEPEEMVLTHHDFGRAYLTEEDGWARRFLVSLFAKNTVLFVGYRHEDTIMTYLTPSLPRDGEEKHFALVGSTSNDLDRWRRMGIEPIVFPQENRNDFTNLDTGIEFLANIRRFGVIDWEQEISKIAEGKPPMIDDDDSYIINHALTEIEFINFFVNAAKLPEWIDWLDDRGYLKRLFTEEKLEEQDRAISQWLASQFIRNHSDKLFSLIQRHNGLLNRDFWNCLLRELSFSGQSPLAPKILSQWVHLLMSQISINTHGFLLVGLAEHCSKAGALQSLLQVYNAITANLIWFLLVFHEDRNHPWDDLMKRLWQQCLAPNLPHIVHSLLERTTMRLEERYTAKMAWNEMDSDNFHRSAIEVHVQDEYPYEIDSLIDVARDCLEWLANNDSVAVKNWCNRFINSDPPLLRRLAIHATNARQDVSADEKITWLLEHCDINEHEAKHEIFHMAACAYPQASSQQKEALIQAVSQYQAPVDKFDDNAAQSAYHQFNWFQWLHKVDPNCSLLEAELSRIRSQYPQFQPRDYPDLNRWIGGASWRAGSWTVEELVAKPASERLSDLLNYQPNEQELVKGGRMSMLITVCNAVARNPSWGLDLADAMAERLEWGSGLWAWVISAWEREDTHLDQDSMRRILSNISRHELHQQNNIQAITGVLNRLIRKAEAADLKKWLDPLHKIAIAMHSHAVAVEDKPKESLKDRDWLYDAINHPSGKLAQFWLHSISHWYNQQAEPPQVLSSEYRDALDIIIHDVGVPGKLGRTILAHEFNFLHDVDSNWTEQHLLPLFDAQHEDFPCAWDGYLARGRLSPSIGELLKEKFISGLQKVIRNFPENRLAIFMQFYILIISCLIDNNRDRNEWIHTFFQQVQEKPELKHMFTTQVRRLLHGLDESSQNEWWNVWLRDYWENRLQGVPCLLDDLEIATMFEWVIHLQGVFPEAVAMAVRMRHVRKDNSSLLCQIGQSNLVDHYPNDLAKFLIYLGQSNRLSLYWKEILNVLYELLKKDLSEELARKLHELIVIIKSS